MSESNEVSLTVRFWSRVQPFDVRNKAACALWLGHRLPAGYGTVTDADGVQHYAHRVSWELLHGPVPENHVIRHVACDLTADDVVAVRHCYRTGRWSQGDLARMFLGSGAGQPTIQRIVSGASYVDLAGPRTTAGRGNPPKRRNK